MKGHTLLTSEVKVGSIFLILSSVLRIRVKYVSADNCLSHVLLRRYSIILSCFSGRFFASLNKFP